MTAILFGFKSSLLDELDQVSVIRSSPNVAEQRSPDFGGICLEGWGRLVHPGYRAEREGGMGESSPRQTGGTFTHKCMNPIWPWTCRGFRWSSGAGPCRQPWPSRQRTERQTMAPCQTLQHSRNTINKIIVFSACILYHHLSHKFTRRFRGCC